MVARTAPTAQLDLFCRHPPLPALARTLLVWATWLLVLVSVSLAVRGWVGAAAPTTPQPRLGRGRAGRRGRFIDLAGRRLATLPAPQRFVSRQTVFWFLPTFAALMLAALLEFSGSPRLGLILIWIMIVVVEVAWNWTLWRSLAEAPGRRRGGDLRARPRPRPPPGGRSSGR